MVHAQLLTDDVNQGRYPAFLVDTCVGIWVEQIVPHRLGVGMVLGI